MTFLDRIGDVLRQYDSGNPKPSREDAHNHYDVIAREVPSEVLAPTIGPAMGTLDADQLRDRVRRSAEQMTPDQRGDLIGSLLGALSASGVNLGSVLNQAGVSPSVAQDPANATPEEVGTIAAHARQNHPEIFNRAMEFYAKHPTLVKAMGVAAVAAIANRLSKGRAL